jgi:hypothetical protein
LRGKRDALVKFRLRELQTFLTGCPLRIRPAASFAHKSFRDYLAAAHYAADPASPDRALLTLDPAVQRFAAEFIDPGGTTAYTQNQLLAPPNWVTVSSICCTRPAIRQWWPTL